MLTIDLNMKFYIFIVRKVINIELFNDQMSVNHKKINNAMLLYEINV